jgi:hypothetical protein
VVEADRALDQVLELAADVHPAGEAVAARVDDPDLSQRRPPALVALRRRSSAPGGVRPEICSPPVLRSRDPFGTRLHAGGDYARMGPT